MTDRPLERAGRLLAGLVLFGLAMALLIESQAGLDPWNVFHQGVFEHVDLTLPVSQVWCAQVRGHPLR